MRIALITHPFPPEGISGIGRYIEDLAGGLADLGHQVVVFAVSRDSAKNNEHRSGYEIEWIKDVAESGLTPFLRLLHLSTRIHYRLKTLHAIEPFHVIEAPNTWAAGLINFAAGLPGKPLRVTRLSTPRAWFRRANRWIPRMTEWLESLQIRYSDLVISNTRENLVIARKVYPLAGRRTLVIHHGIDSPVLTGTATGDTGPVVLYIGRMEHRKGFDLLARAWKTVLERHPNATLEVIGQDLPAPDGSPSYFNWALRSLTDMQKEKIHYHGDASDDIRDKLLMKCRLVAIPSRYESFGIVLLEAMVRERPVVAFAVGGIPEIVDHERTGILAVPESPVELAEAICKLLSRPDLCQNMGEAARSHVLNNFSIRRMAKASVTAYRDMDAANDV